MARETIVREWFGAVRDAANRAAKTLVDPPAPGSLSGVRTALLLRQYLRSGLELYVAQCEGVGRAEAGEICGQVYSELVEDAMAGIRSPQETMELVRFLELCADGAAKRPMFAELLRRALERDVSDAEAASLADAADRALSRFAGQRRTAR